MAMKYFDCIQTTICNNDDTNNTNNKRITVHPGQQNNPRPTQTHRHNTTMAVRLEAEERQRRACGDTRRRHFHFSHGVSLAAG